MPAAQIFGLTVADVGHIEAWLDSAVLQTETIFNHGEKKTFMNGFEGMGRLDTDLFAVDFFSCVQMQQDNRKQ